MQIIPDARLEGLRVANQAAAGMRATGQTLSNIIGNTFLNKLRQARSQFDMSTKMGQGLGQQLAYQMAGGDKTIGGGLRDEYGREAENTYDAGTQLLSRQLQSALSNPNLSSGDAMLIVDYYQKMHEGLKSRYDVGGGSRLDTSLLGYGKKGGKKEKPIAHIITNQEGEQATVYLTSDEVMSEESTAKALEKRYRKTLSNLNYKNGIDALTGLTISGKDSPVGKKKELDIQRRTELEQTTKAREKLSGLNLYASETDLVEISNILPEGYRIIKVDKEHSDTQFANPGADNYAIVDREGKLLDVASIEDYSESKKSSVASSGARTKKPSKPWRK